MSKIGVYCGSFNPFHIGHWDITIQSAFIFDDVIVARGINDSKNETLEPIPEIIHKTCIVKEYNGLLTEFLDSLQEEYPDSTITLIRGLRNSQDFEDEKNLRDWLNLENYNVIYLMADKDYRHVSSSAIRNLRNKYPDLVDDYLLH